MKTVKQILEHINYTNDENHIVSGLSQLAESGLLDESKLPLIKRALTKSNINEMTEAEKKSLNYFVESMMVHLLSEKQDHFSKFDSKLKSGYPSEKDMPVVLVLKRKAIRVFPDHQKVGLYYSQALDKYISIPFGPNSKNLGVDLNEETLQEISQEKATAAYAEREKRKEQIKKDPSLSPAQKAIAMAKENRRQKALSQRMRTNVTDIATGKNIRSWAGKDAVNTAKEAGRIAISDMNKNSPEEQAKEFFKASPEKRVAMKQSGYEPKFSDVAAQSGGHPVLAGMAYLGSKIGDAMRTPKATPKSIKESFQEKLERKRQEKLDEGISDYIPSWEKTKEVAKSMVPGVDAYNAYKEGRYLDMAGNLALDAATIGAGIATGGVGAAAIRGASSAAKAAKAAKTGSKLGAATTASKEGFKSSKGWSAAKAVGRGARGIARGAANIAGAALGAAAGGGSGDSESIFKRTQSDRPDFGASLKSATIGGALESEITRARRATIAYEIGRAHV